jgi:hypothetical protein
MLRYEVDKTSQVLTNQVCNCTHMSFEMKFEVWLFSQLKVDR